MSQFNQQILPTAYAGGTPTGFGMTKVWGYGGNAKDAITGEFLGYFRNTPGATFETKAGEPVEVKWINRITSPSIFAVDPTLHWANPNMMPMESNASFPSIPTRLP